MLAPGLMISEKKIFEGSLAIQLTPWGIASSEPRDLIGRINVGDL